MRYYEKPDARRRVNNIVGKVLYPKMEVLYPLVKALKIDAREIFNPEMQRETPAIQRLRFLIEDCNEDIFYNIL